MWYRPTTSGVLSAALLALVVLLGVQPHAAADSDGSSPFKPEDLEAVVAPIALYPDALLSQIFMASTYPLEVVEAARWSKEHPDVTGDAVADAVKDQSWDPSVKSLVAFPQVLTMMNEKLDWTQKLGDAFLAQQADVMQAVQRLRNKAMDTGNLESTDELTVKTEPAPPATATTTAAPAQTIIIESPNPEVIYVPTYNPTVVYGVWGYPAYPPYYYYPPGYVAGASFWSFTAGVVVGGALWGNCNWGRNDIDIDIHRENNFNRVSNTNIDRSRTNNTWQHNSEHRKGVGYRDAATQQKYTRGSGQGVQSREQYRGRAEQGRQQIAREGAGSQRDLSGNPIGSRDTTRGSASNRASTPGAGASSRVAGSSRNAGSSLSSGSRSGAFGSGRSASHTRASANRGMSSRSSAGMRGGGMRGGGGRRR
jgi:hypothetical protein